MKKIFTLYNTLIFFLILDGLWIIALIIFILVKVDFS